MTPSDDPAAPTEVWSAAGPRHATPRKRPWAKPLSDLRAGVQAQLARLELPSADDLAEEGPQPAGASWTVEDAASLASSALALADAASAEAGAARTEAADARRAAEAAQAGAQAARAETSGAYAAADAAHAQAAVAVAEAQALRAELAELRATTARQATVAWSGAGAALVLAVIALAVGLG